MNDELLDARGVPITPGDTVIYGFGVGRSIAMAEGVVVNDMGEWGSRLSLTPSGRVRLRVVRRSFDSGTKPVVDVAPDRLVVLKVSPYPELMGPHLPPSPLPTQDEENRQRLRNLAEAYTADLRATEVPDRWYYEGWTLGEFHVRAAERLAEVRTKLKELDDDEG